MKKKLYNQPAIAVTEIQTLSIICASLPIGNSGDPIDGD